MEPLYRTQCISLGTPDFVVKAVQIALAVSGKDGRLRPLLFGGVMGFPLFGCS